jgi:site-specific DNA-adenine methylase
MTEPLRSLLPWTGGKYYSAQRILATFPRLQARHMHHTLLGGASSVQAHDQGNASGSDIGRAAHRCRYR